MNEVDALLIVGEVKEEKKSNIVYGMWQNEVILKTEYMATKIIYCIYILFYF